MFLRRHFFGIYATIAAIDLALIAGSLALGDGIRCPVPAINNQLDLTRDGNLAAVLATVQIFMLALTAVAIAWVAPAPFGMSTKMHGMTWLGVALTAFMLLAHEHVVWRGWIMGFYAANFGEGGRFALLFGADNLHRWIPLLAVPIAGGIIGLMHLAKYCLRSHRNDVFLAACGFLCWLLAMSVEVVNQRLLSQSPLLPDRAPLLISSFILLGTALLLIGLLEHLRREAEFIRPAPIAVDSNDPWSYTT